MRGLGGGAVDGEGEGLVKSQGFRRLEDEGDVRVIGVHVFGEFQEGVCCCGGIEFLHKQNVSRWSGPFEGQKIVIRGDGSSVACGLAAPSGL